MSRSTLVAVALILALAGCAAETDDTRPPVTGFPARPADVATETLDSCAMFDSAQQAELGLRKATPKPATVNGMPSSGCVWLGETDIGYNTQTIPIGAEVALTDPAGTVLQVNGFGAVRNVVREMTGGAPTCQVTIDAAPSQSIRVQAQADRQDRSDDEMCRLATDAASMVMTTVVGAAR